jgi:hypothetical protein
VQVIDTENGKVASLISVRDSFDIPPGETTELDLVFRTKGETDCFGWCNKSYPHRWRHPLWKFDRGIYIARVRIVSGGQEYVNAFRVFNDVPFDDYRLGKINQALIKELSIGI